MQNLENTGIEIDTNQIDTQRTRVVDALDLEMQRRSDVLYYTTNHFIVVFRDTPKIYQEFGKFDKQPSTLAEYLEDNLQKCLSHFGLPLPKTVQVVVARKGGVTDSFKAGYHSGQRKHSFDRDLDLKTPQEVKAQKEPIVFYSHIFPKKNESDEDGPSIYKTAIHEAIGHGFINTALFGPLEEKGPRRLGFLEEGLAFYIADFATGKDPHDAMVKELVFAFNWVFRGIKSGKVFSEEDIKKNLAKKGLLSNLTLEDFFKLKSNSNDVSQNDKMFKGLKESLPNYYRGASFLGFLIETYGMEKFKEWITSVDPSNFYEILSETYGLSIEDIEAQWKRKVLSKNFSDISDVAKNFSKDQLKWMQDVGMKYC